MKLIRNERRPVSQEWQRIGKRGPKRGTLAERMQKFWTYVDKNGPIPEGRPDLGSCWLWKGRRGHKADSYATFHVFELSHAAAMRELRRAEKPSDELRTDLHLYAPERCLCSECRARRQAEAGRR